jgi:hypothetical protein
MSLLNIDGRIVYINAKRYEAIGDVQELCPLDYDNINVQLDTQRKLSTVYLKTLLDEANDKFLCDIK